MIFTTAWNCASLPIALLWFAFKLFFDDIYHSFNVMHSAYICVVICFQIVLWWYLPQQYTTDKYNLRSCDLLSNCSLMIFTTAFFVECSFILKLWFAFKLFFDDIYHSVHLHRRVHVRVVICFQIVLWWYLPQPVFTNILSSFSCDLLSNCSLMIFTTAIGH